MLTSRALILSALVLPTAIALAPADAADARRFTVGLEEVPDVVALPGARVVRVDRLLGFAVVEASPVAADALARLPGVLWVEEAPAVRAFAAPTDPLWAEQWGPARMGLAAAREMETGSADVVVAVLDTGVDYTHPDLAAHVWNGNGLHGWNLAGEGSALSCTTAIPLLPPHIDCYAFLLEEDALATPMDLNGHGTHVAGTVAAVADNGEGVAGMAAVTIMPVKVLACGTCIWNFGDVISSGIALAVHEGADVVSMSLGACADAPWTSLALALDYAEAAGVLVVAAAGNENTDVPCWPAAYPTVLSVAATDRGDVKAGFSSWGETVDVAAPGVDVLSLRSHVVSNAGWQVVGHGYSRMMGTSMATPHVAGAAALVMSANPSLTHREVRDILEATADDLGAPGRDPHFGAGLVRADLAVGRALSSS